MATTTNGDPVTTGNRSSKVQAPVLGAGDRIGEGDTYLVENVLPSEVAEVAFEDLMKEVAWNVMHHRGPLDPPSQHPRVGHLSPLGGEVPRLVAVQGEIDADGK